MYMCITLKHLDQFQHNLAHICLTHFEKKCCRGKIPLRDEGGKSVTCKTNREKICNSVKSTFTRLRRSTVTSRVKHPLARFQE